MCIAETHVAPRFHVSEPLTFDRHGGSRAEGPEPCADDPNCTPLIGDAILTHPATLAVYTFWGFIVAYLGALALLNLLRPLCARLSTRRTNVNVNEGPAADEAWLLGDDEPSSPAAARDSANNSEAELG